MDKKRISLFTVLEILALLYGTALSISGTVKTLGYTSKYIGCFVFAAMGIAFVVILVMRIRKKYTPLIGWGLVVLYFVTAGFGYVVCSVNTHRLRSLSYYEGKEVTAVMDDRSYRWNGGVIYSDEGLEYIPDGVTVYADGEKKGTACLTDGGNIYFEIDVSASGEYLVLEEE